MNKVSSIFPKASLLMAMGVSTLMPSAFAEDSTFHYSPNVNSSNATGVFWGDTHLHTSFSTDAGAFGNRLTPDDAYRLARGEQITSSTGQPVKLSRPLDFLVVADHSDGMGFFADLYAGKDNIVSDPQGKDWYDRVMAGDGGSVAMEIIGQFSQGTFPHSLSYKPDSAPYKNAWDRTVDAAEKFNNPGAFTAFIGYEWTSLIKGNNLHRVVVYRDGEDKTRQMVPYTTTPPEGSPNPLDLWQWLAKYEEKTGGDVLAIPHNGNLSNGDMFPLDAQYDGKLLDAFYAQQRSKWEPIYEVSQYKGDGEAHPKLSPTDEFADFGTWDKGNLDLSVLKTDDMLAGEYGREALKRGLQIEKKLGTNPYNFGLIAATDSHTGLPTVEEDNFFSKFALYEPNKTRANTPSKLQGKVAIQGWEYVSSGLAAVWAQENTREAIFDAMERKEVYGTTGPRMAVRFFGGWNFSEDDVQAANPATIGYAKGVPMGGQLAAKAAKAPTFMVYALRDPLGANLDRIQVVKGWLDKNGETQEKVYDVVWAGDRKIRKGKLAPIGNTVDVKNATWSNTIGEGELATVWTDPDFDAKQQAFYYARVLEIPKPRWTVYDAKRFDIDLAAAAPTSIQDRAYTSPIWYKP